jgi:hypothetical protein
MDIDFLIYELLQTEPRDVNRTEDTSFKYKRGEVDFGVTVQEH